MVRRASGFHQGGSGCRPVLVLQQDLIQLFSSGLPWGASAKDCRSSAEGGNLRIDYRWGGGSIERTRTYAVELVAVKPDVILGGAASAAVALHRETRGPAPRRIGPIPVSCHIHPPTVYRHPLQQKPATHAQARREPRRATARHASHGPVIPTFAGAGFEARARAGAPANGASRYPAATRFREVRSTM